MFRHQQDTRLKEEGQPNGEWVSRHCAWQCAPTVPRVHTIISFRNVDADGAIVVPGGVCKYTDGNGQKMDKQ